MYLISDSTCTTIHKNILEYNRNEAKFLIQLSTEQKSSERLHNEIISLGFGYHWSWSCFSKAWSNTPSYLT